MSLRTLITGVIVGVAACGAVALPGVALAAPAPGVDTTTGPVGTSVRLSPTPCPAPAGAGAWTSLVRFAQGSNGQLSFANFAVAANGSWSGQFRIPTGAVPGAAQLVAQCFDASHTVQTTVDYTPVDFTVTPSTLGPHETVGPVGTVFGLSPSVCPAPAGARAWTSLVRFAQGSNPALSFANYPVAADGSWGGTFSIPTGAVPGIGQLTAQCFDPSHPIATTVDYASESFLVVQSTLNASPTSGPRGTSVGLSADTCPAPAGARSWTALVRFAQGGNPEVSFANFAVATDGSWSGTFTIPSAAVPGAAQLVGQCFDASHAVQLTVDYTPVSFVVTPGVATATPTPTPTRTSTPTPTRTSTPTRTPTPTPSTGGGGGPGPGQTPELDSLVLFGSGVIGLAGLARLRFLATRRRRDKEPRD